MITTTIYPPGYTPDRPEYGGFADIDFKLPDPEAYTGRVGIEAQIETDADFAMMLLSRARLLSFYCRKGFDIIAATQAQWEENYAIDLADDHVRAGENDGGIRHRLDDLGIDPGLVDGYNDGAALAAIEGDESETGVGD